MLYHTAEKVGGSKSWLLILLARSSVVRLTHTHFSTEQGSECGVMQNSVYASCFYFCALLQLCLRNCLREYVSR